MGEFLLGHINLCEYECTSGTRYKKVIRNRVSQVYAWVRVVR